MCVDHEEMGVSENHQSSQVSTQRGTEILVLSCLVLYFVSDVLNPLAFLRGSVSSLSVHPSGKLVLTVGTDKTLRYNTELYWKICEADYYWIKVE